MGEQERRNGQGLDLSLSSTSSGPTYPVGWKNTQRVTKKSRKGIPTEMLTIVMVSVAKTYFQRSKVLGALSPEFGIGNERPFLSALET